MTTGWRLIVSRDDQRVLERAVPMGVSTIGRSADNRFVLDGPRVSRFHAALFVSTDGSIHVQDMGSKNGTFLADRRVGRLRLKSGDRFRLGSYVCEAVAPEGGAVPVVDVTTSMGTAPGEEIPDSQAIEGIFLGASAAARKVLAQARRAADTDFNLLILGESGSGKGVVARLVHQWSLRSKAPFVVVNCAAIPAELVESELFGHRRGAFTGAVADRPGKFRAANGGTLLLDEVGDLPLPAQAKILRAIEDQEVEPLGEPGPVKVDVRVLAATHQDLETAVAERRFRLDLFHRLSTATLVVPPLRDRRDDIVVLANWFLGELIDDIPWAQGATFSSDAIAVLSSHEWPGNVRELRNTIAQALLAKQGEIIEASDIRFARGGATAEVPASATLAEAEGMHITRALDHHGWNLRKTAKALGISRSTLHDRMDRLGLARGTERTTADDAAD